MLWQEKIQVLKRYGSGKNLYFCALLTALLTAGTFVEVLLLKLNLKPRALARNTVFLFEIFERLQIASLTLHVGDFMKQNLPTYFKTFHSQSWIVPLYIKPLVLFFIGKFVCFFLHLQ